MRRPLGGATVFGTPGREAEKTVFESLFAVSS